MTALHAEFSWPRLLTRLQKVAWVLFLITLPVTSFPYLPSMIGGVALVRPLSIYPLILLLVIAIIPRLFSRPIPMTIGSILPFILIAIASSVLSLLGDIDPMLGVTVGERVLRAMLTLGLGIAIYLTVSIFPRSPDELRSSLRWFYVGFILALFWGSLQAVYVLQFNPAYFQFLNRLQGYISTRKIFYNRVSGMTYEPNWFGEQISFLLIPWLLGSVLSGESVFRWRWRKVTVEWILLLWSIFILILTFSRAGLANLVFLLVLSLIFLRAPRGRTTTLGRSSLARWSRRILEAGLVLALFIGMVFTASTRNEFFSRIWNYWSEVKEQSLGDFFEYIGFGARFMYAEAAYNTYTANPVLGVGLGNYAFFFQEMLPDEMLASTPEVLRILTPEIGRNRLITPKNLYFRILAETGLIGMAAFLAFLIAILGCALFLRLSSDPQQNYWGTAGLLGLLVFFVAAFSFDSLALPNMWVVFGLVTSSTWIFYRSEKGDHTFNTSRISGKKQ